MHVFIFSKKIKTKGSLGLHVHVYEDSENFAQLISQMENFKVIQELFTIVPLNTVPEC